MQLFHSGNEAELVGRNGLWLILCVEYWPDGIPPLFTTDLPDAPEAASWKSTSIWMTRRTSAPLILGSNPALKRSHANCISFPINPPFISKSSEFLMFGELREAKRDTGISRFAHERLLTMCSNPLAHDSDTSVRFRVKVLWKITQLTPKFLAVPKACFNRAQSPLSL